MARTKEQKKEIIGQIEKIVDGAETMVFVNIHGLKVADSMSLRRSLKKEGVGLFVAKKSLTKKVLESKKYSGSMPELVGEFGLAYGKDQIAAARGIYDFEKTNKGTIAIVGGVFEKTFKNKDEMVAIASIPPLKTLYGMFANVINSPIQGLVMALDQISKKAPAA